MAQPRISVVIPTLNEARNLPSVLHALPRDLHEVIVVDAHSTDGTVTVARAHYPGVRVIYQTRRGKGNALCCGFAACSGDIVVTLDADGSADGAEIPTFIAALVGGADFAKGTRFASGGGSADITRSRRAGNALLTGLVNLLYAVRYTDLCYGYNAFWIRCLDALQPECDGFEIESLMAVRAARAGLRIREVPSFEHPRLHEASNLHALRDGWRVLRTILRERRGPDPIARDPGPIAPEEIRLA